MPSTSQFGELLAAVDDLLSIVDGTEGVPKETRIRAKEHVVIGLANEFNLADELPNLTAHALTTKTGLPIKWGENSGPWTKDPFVCLWREQMQWFRDIVAELAGDGTGKKAKPRRLAGTRNQKADDKIIGALIKHHEYDNGSVGKFEYADPKTLAKLADVTPPTISKFWKRTDFFKSYDGYCVSCRDKSIAYKLKFLNRDYSELATLDPYAMDGGKSDDD